jgi:hypothetical protein
MNSGLVSAARTLGLKGSQVVYDKYEPHYRWRRRLWAILIRSGRWRYPRAIYRL